MSLATAKEETQRNETHTSCSVPTAYNKTRKIGKKQLRIWKKMPQITLMDDNNNNNKRSNGVPLLPCAPSPKRLRGGGGEDEELFDEEFVDMAADYEIPNDVDDAVELAEDSKSKWSRPPLPKGLDNKTDLNVQWLDIDMMGGPPLKENPNKAKKVAGNTLGQNVPVIRVFGVNEAGHSVTVFIHGFTPYAYFALPPSYQPSMFTESNKTKIRNALDDRLRSTARGEKLQQYVLGVEYLPHHKSIMGYETSHTQFLKVHLSMPTLVPTLKRVMGEGVNLGMVASDGGPPPPAGELSYEPYECNVPFVLRYMIDRDITGAGWLTLPKETYQFRPDSTKTTHCQVRR